MTYSTDYCDVVARIEVGKRVAQQHFRCGAFPKREAWRSLLGVGGEAAISERVDSTCAQKVNIKKERNIILEDAILIIAFRTIILVP